MKAATGAEQVNDAVKQFQSTPPVKAATSFVQRFKLAVGISIHAAREGGDGDFRSVMPYFKRFQSTPPVKAATQAGLRPRSRLPFQSTPPVKAATPSPLFSFSPNVFQSTPPVKAATWAVCRFSCTYGISIHAAREGGDLYGKAAERDHRNFNPRRP